MAARKGVIADVDTDLESVETEEKIDDIVETTETENQVSETDDDEFDPDAPLFDGGPTSNEIEAWKEQYGDVYVTTFGPDKHVIWRTLLRSEYRQLIKQLDVMLSSGQMSQAEANLNNEEMVAEKCILFPRLSRVEFAGEMAGVASIISQEVMEASGFIAADVRQL